MSSNNILLKVVAKLVKIYVTCNAFHKKFISFAKFITNLLR